MPNKNGKLTPLEKLMIETEGYELSRVTMYLQGLDGNASKHVHTVMAVIRPIGESGLVWQVRPQANKRSFNRFTICTTTTRLISIEKLAVTK